MRVKIHTMLMTNKSGFRLLSDMRKSIITLIAVLVALLANAQTGLKKVYNEDINPLEQIDRAIVKAKSEGKFVVCQVGGNWCPWCLRFADFISKDTAISKVIDENFEYIHVNYDPRKSEGKKLQTGDGTSEMAQQQQAAALMKRLNNCGRFGFPVFVVLDEDGKVIHIQDSSFLEKMASETNGSLGEGEQELGYNQEKVLRFFKNWTPKAVKNL